MDVEVVVPEKQMGVCSAISTAAAAASLPWTAPAPDTSIAAHEEKAEEGAAAR